ncbi:hypothetical protein BFW01_g1208 [Lasiodiplodia theobromae]|uniref:AAA+ ATPase domain-containing protein n=1 Tax=Lasiodiplodia theobromae TaxID=45133 RepID=A0A8H7IRZ6_9PEZI|nr:hypothetical protein BFW01_g1208 [Lasiodiplodia theobromae]
MISHLEFLLKYINEGLKPHMSNYRRLRARDVKKVAFKDLWYLFAPGDKVYDASAKQAFQVVGVRGGRALLSKSEDDDDRIKVASENDYAVEDLGPFIIDCFYLGFNGEELGPVNHSVRILPYDGEQAISNLRLYPLEYARMKVDVDDVAGDIPMEEHLSRRGQKFVAFLNPHEVAHREYVGFSVGNVREQIDSRVIIDMALYYEAHPDDQPTLGLMRPPEADRREIEERKTCRCPDCSGRRNIHIYDDRHIDSQRTNEFIAANSKNWRLIRDATGKLTPDQLSLLPAKAYGYVLRTRKWYELDVDKIMEVEQKPENFQDLVLPKMYKQLVEGMVRTHSRSVKPNASGKDETTQVQGNDLVRGKGKGVIILLHGVPGVGKTSTAECVAEYTSRPLFAITCGDIGENAQQVEQNLEENFQLAHRWGCVMLLDEADVFLQTRNKQDMQRNAVVSVFLRILEYYSGILFLTTNKVGTFDEAFKSRIHLSLYYPPLNDDQTKAIWEVNLARLKRYHPGLDIEDRSIMTWVKSLIRERERDNFRPWNGRQIHNACQTAASIALFQDEGKLTLEHFEIVSQASMAFDQYLRDVHGTDDSGRAKRAQDRDDQFWDNQLDYEHGFESSSRRDKDNYISFGRRREHRQYGMADDRYQSDSEDGGHRLSQYARHSRDEPGYSYTQGSQRSNRRPQHAERMPGQDRQDSRRRRRRLPSLDRPISGWESDSDLQDSRRGDRPDLPTRNPKRHNTFED